MSEEATGTEGYAKADLSFEPETEDEQTGDSKRKRSESNEDSATEFKKNRSESPDAVDKNDNLVSGDVVVATGYTAVQAGADPAIAPYTNSYSAPESSTEIVTDTSEIAQEKVGQVIGSKGAIIQDLQARSACKIQVNQDFPQGVPRQVVYTGTQAQVNAAKELVSLVLEKGPTALLLLNGPVVTEIVECAQAVVGRVIGSSGCNIRDIQMRCNVKIQVHQDFPENVPRQVEITGNAESVAAAAHCVRQIIDGTSQGVGMPMGMPMMGMPMGMGVGGAGVSAVNGVHIVECAKQYVGRIIGRGGETINLLQSKSGARVQIDQKVPEGVPCRVNISGNPDSVNLAIQMVQELIAQGPNRLAMYPNYSPAHGGVQMGGYAQQGGRYYDPSQQMGGYTGGYGSQQGGYYQQPQQGGYYQQQGGYQQQVAHAGVYAQTAATPASGSPWTEHKTDEGISYWYNASTGVSQWDAPS